MRTLVYLCVMLFLLPAGGCRLFNDQPTVQGRSPLRPAKATPDSLRMEIIWARFPQGDPQWNEAVWQEIDETQIAPAVRRALAENGFRVGVVSGRLPDAIARALDPEQKRSSREAVDDGEAALNRLIDPTVRGWKKQLRRNQRAEVQASDVYPSLPLLINQDRELRGRTYQDAQAIYALRVAAQPDRTVEVELTPELHHGQPRLRWVGGDDIPLRQAVLREREVFDQLRFTARLAPGEMLVLMGMPDAGSRLGHYFHTVDGTDGRQQKLILIRPAELPPSDTFVGLAGF